MTSSKVVNPLGSMMLLSQLEVDKLKRSVDSQLYHLFRNCSLAILNSGIETDDSKALLARCSTFDINILSRERGVKLELIDPPETAFVDGKLIKTIHANLFAVLRDILFVHTEYPQLHHQKALTDSSTLTGIVFKILRNANVLHVGETPNLVVCWGGHSINQHEYLYAHQVGLQLGLRELNICTGCGAGIMEAPMKGAAVGHAQQSYKESRFIGITEPSIIASEPPNSLVNELVIMPDIEKRLEAFVRLAHGVVIFPGGPGTTEELLYMLGILMTEGNTDQRLPLILTGPKESIDYFHSLEIFLIHTFGEEVKRYYTLIIDDPIEVARTLSKQMKAVKDYRLRAGDAFGFNWSLKIPERLQIPFLPTHQNMSSLNLSYEQSQADLASALRCAFSGIVAGNIKEPAIQAIREQGVYQLHGDVTIMKNMDKLLKEFVQQHRMKLPNKVAYQPCYEILL